MEALQAAVRELEDLRQERVDDVRLTVEAIVSGLGEFQIITEELS